MSEKGTEQASPQRKQKAKEQGDIVRSRELTSAVAMLAGTMALGWCAQGFIRTWRSIYVECLRLGLDSRLNQDALWRTALRQVFAPVMASLAMMLAASFAGAVVTGMAQGGGLSLHPNAPLHESRPRGGRVPSSVQWAPASSRS